jgi:hypothetical protein
MARIPAMTPTSSMVRSAHNAGGRIMEHKNTTVGGDSAITRRLKVPARMSASVTVVGKETIGGLGVGPILARSGML